MSTIILHHKSSRVKGQEGYLFVDDGGSGKLPVVFVHSFGGDTTHWKNQLNHLRENRRAIAFDLRGHGKSDPSSTQNYSAESLAGDIAAVVDSLDLENFILVGHSMGGSAAVAYTDTHPSRVSGLLLAGTPGKTPAEIVETVVTSLQSDKYQKVMDDYMKQLVTDARPAVRELVNEGVERIPRETSIAIIKALFEFDPIDKIKKYPGPKLIISTSHEGNQPNALYNQLPDVLNYVIEGTSHWVQLDKPDEFNKVLDEFLRRVEHS